MTTGVEPGLIKTLLGPLLKPFELVFTPVAERIGSWLRRKPRLHIHFYPLNCHWCIGKHGDTELMQITFVADFNHDARKDSLIIVDVYPKGARSWHPFQRFMIKPGEFINEHCFSLVQPLVAEKGKDWTGRLIFVDQFNRKYKSPKFTYKWVGPSPVKPAGAN